MERKGGDTGELRDRDPAGKVPFVKKFAYALPAGALAVIGIPVYVYIPKFYTDVVGINVTILGYLLFSVRIFDALTDPLIGHISDRTNSRFGRRRPYLAFGSVFVVMLMVALFNPPYSSPGMETIWFGVTIYGLFFFWTIVTVPYESLGPEITYDYHERTSLFSWRDGFLIGGTLVAASAPALVRLLFQLPETGEGERATFFWISIFYSPLIIGACWWCVWRVREVAPQQVSTSSPLAAGIRHVFSNRPFMILLAAYTISAIGNNLPATLILYYVEYVLESDMADFFLLLYFVTGIIFLPGWVAISKKTGKKLAWICSMALNTGAFVGVFFLGAGDSFIYGVLVFLSGIGFGATLAIPSAIQADVIDYDELRTGQRREGQYIGLWSISKKLAAAVGIGVGLSVLGMAGYAPNVEQSEDVRLVLRSLYALVPSLCNLLGLGIAFAYPISGTVHDRIRQGIERRKRGEPVTDPLRPNTLIEES